MRTFHSLSRPLAENPGRAAKRDPVAIAPFPLGIVLACSLVPGLEHTQFPRYPPALPPCKTIESVSNFPSHRYFRFRPDLLCSLSISYRVNRWLTDRFVRGKRRCGVPAAPWNSLDGLSDELWAHADKAKVCAANSKFKFGPSTFIVSGK